MTTPHADAHIADEHSAANIEDEMYQKSQKYLPTSAVDRPASQSKQTDEKRKLDLKPP